MSAERFSYDAVAYPSHPLPQAHPDRLATLAALFGLSPAPPERCRVLELGCGDGANLVPLAYALPDSRFLGIDLAETAVAKGRAVARELGLANAELRHADLMELPSDLGEFDYVIAHGLYSWVPAPVRDRILKICADHLAPQGVAYVSYNTFPGGRVRQMIRDMMRFHVRDFPEPERRIAQSRSLVKFLAEGHTAEGPYRDLLREELRRVGFEKDEAVLYHDDLSEVNDPVYFHEFAAHAAAHGLQYLGEADFFEMQDRLYPPHIAKELRELGERDVLLKEQYLDFLKLRRFRQTLLCRRGVPM